MKDELKLEAKDFGRFLQYLIKYKEDFKKNIYSKVKPHLSGLDLHGRPCFYVLFIICYVLYDNVVLPS